MSAASSGGGNKRHLADGRKDQAVCSVLVNWPKLALNMTQRLRTVASVSMDTYFHLRSRRRTADKNARQERHFKRQLVERRTATFHQCLAS